MKRALTYIAAMLVLGSSFAGIDKKKKNEDGVREGRRRDDSNIHSSNTERERGEEKEEEGACALSFTYRDHLQEKRQQGPTRTQSMHPSFRKSELCK